MDKTIIPILLHVEQNEIPAVISQLLARSINDLEKYLEELDALDAGREVETPTEIDSSTKCIEGLKIGEKVRVIDAEHLTDEDKMQSPKWTKSMDKYSGVMTEIVGFTKQGNAMLAVDDTEFRVPFYSRHADPIPYQPAYLYHSPVRTFRSGSDSDCPALIRIDLSCR